MACATLGKGFAHRLGTCHVHNGANTPSLRLLLNPSLHSSNNLVGRTTTELPCSGLGGLIIILVGLACSLGYWARGLADSFTNRVSDTDANCLSLLFATPHTREV